jgi:hypothetical protein
MYLALRFQCLNFESTIKNSYLDSQDLAFDSDCGNPDSCAEHF